MRLPAEAPARLTERLGPYRLVNRIGEGGMGEVYLALDPSGRAVAIKVLRDHVAHDAGARARLARELDTLSRVRHGRVAAVIDADVHGERPYLVTRYVAGPPLDYVVDEHGALRGDELVGLGRGLVAAVEAIHSVGVVHRDIKPANVLMEEDVEPVLIDFGIAHIADDIRLTSTGLVMGTPGYLSPEVIEGAPVTEATDWWGWAATLTFATTGRPPFGRGPMEVVLSRVRRGEVDLAGVDGRLEPLLAAALSPRPADRPPARTVLAAFERYAVSPPTGAVLRVVPGGRSEPEPDGLTPPTEVVSARHTEVLRQANGSDPRSGSAPAPGPRPATWGPPPAYPPHAQPPQQDAPDRAEDGAPGQPDPRIGRPDRSGTLLAMAAALGALAALAPMVAVLVAVGWSWMARVADRSMTALVLRRWQNGRRRSDLPVAVALGPWHLVRAAAATVLGVLLPLMVGVATAFCVSLVVSALTGAAPSPGSAPALAAGGLVAVLMGWWGPGGAGLRRGSRSVVRGVARPGLTADLVVGALVAVTLGIAVWSCLRGGVPMWWPLAGAPDALQSARR